MQFDKTISHYHTDPKVINQQDIGLYEPGTIMYLDAFSGYYKPAIANDFNSSCVMGFIWQVYGANKVSLKTEFCHLQYGTPLWETWYNKIDGKVDPTSPNWHKIPGELGRQLYLSETVAGAVQANYPTGGYKVIIGYKTLYGMIWRPENLTACPYMPETGP